MTMAPARLGDCVRCFDPRPAVTVKRLTVGADGAYDLALCAQHGDLFTRDMYGWTRCGTLADDEAEPRRLPTGNRGTVIVSHVHIPVVAVDDPVDEPDVTPYEHNKPHPSASALPDGWEQWTFTSHALDRQVTRGVSKAEALWCALDPDVIRPGSVAGTFIHVKQHVQVVVNPAQRRIVTVIDRTISSEQEVSA